MFQSLFRGEESVAVRTAAYSRLQLVESFRRPVVEPVGLRASQQFDDKRFFFLIIFIIIFIKNQ